MAATSVVKYGLTSKYGLTTQNNTFVTTHQLTISAPNLSAATNYLFEVESVNNGGVGNTSVAQSFTTLGFPVTIRVVDAYGQVVKGATVTVGGQSQTTNSSGIATFANTPPGAQKVTIKIGNASTTRAITVNGSTSTSGTASSLQQFSLSAVRGKDNAVYFEIAVVIIAFGIVGTLFIPRKQLQHPSLAGVGFGQNPDPDLLGRVNTQATLNASGINPTTEVSNEPGQVITPQAETTNQPEPSQIISPTDPPSPPPPWSAPEPGPESHDPDNH